MDTNNHTRTADAQPEPAEAPSALSQTEKLKDRIHDDVGAMRDLIDLSEFDRIDGPLEKLAKLTGEARLLLQAALDAGAGGNQDDAPAVRDRIHADIFDALRTVESFDVDQQPGADQKLAGIASMASALSTALNELCQCEPGHSRNIAAIAKQVSRPAEDPARAPAPLDPSNHITDIELADGSRVDVEARNYSMQRLLHPSADLFDNHYQLLLGIIATARQLFLEVNEPAEGYGINKPAVDISCALDCLVDQLDKEMRGGAA